MSDPPEERDETEESANAEEPSAIASTPAPEESAEQIDQGAEAPADSGADAPTQSFFERPSTHLKLWSALLVGAVTSVVADLTYHKHVHFEVEDYVGFYGIVGFLATTVIMLIGGWLRALLARDEGYYD